MTISFNLKLSELHGKSIKIWPLLQNRETFNLKPFELHGKMQQNSAFTSNQRDLQLKTM